MKSKTKGKVGQPKIENIQKKKRRKIKGLENGRKRL